MVKNYKYGKPYKFKSLEVYVSTEWMANKQLKYRNVFDIKEINYLRFQFSFYNKLFDEENWTGEFSIKVHNSDGKELCNLSKKLEIEKTKNIFSYKRGWGTDDFGGFWEKGTYVLSAFVDEELVEKKEFFIYDAGIVKQTFNPYFEVSNLRFFEGGYDVPENKYYFKVFSKEKTRYIWIDFNIKNKYIENWNNEVFFYIFDDAGQLKAKLREQYLVDVKKNKNISLFTGWGNKDGGSWKDDKYFVNVVFMDTLIASSSFEMGEENIAGVPEMSVGKMKSMLEQEVSNIEHEEKSLEELLQSLNELIGLETIKKKITEHLNYIDFIKLRKEKGFSETEKLSLHSVFTGNPGTGKTTVVKLLGAIYQQMGLLSKGHVYEVDRTVLVGEYIGQTAPKVKKAIEEARGGILFIDEAYALFRSKEDDKDFGREVIEILIKEMSDGPGDIAIMFAGYPKEMQIFLNSNPGLKSRVSSYFSFPDYTPDELVDISVYAAKKQDVIITPKALVILRKIIVEAYRNRDNAFGNARFAHSLIDRAKMNMGLRIVSNPNFKKLTKKEISTITKEDVQKLVKQKSESLVEMDMDENLLTESLEELNSLVGLDYVKNNVAELVKLVRYYREIGKDVLNSFSMHAIFTGNPGTGKTTIARILGKIYKALGLLERGHVVETDREGLIAGYIGQTAIKTKEMIDKAKGGVLFIDEAYGLTDNNQDSFGSEAIEVILKNMEDKRGQFAVIAAGYPDNMDKFLKANPGLMSRFDKVIHFRDYSYNELLLIAKIMLAEFNLYFNEESKKYFDNYLQNITQKTDKYFGNAREVRKMVEEIARKQNLRMADSEKENRTPENIRTVTIEDVQYLKYEKPKAKSIGFGI